MFICDLLKGPNLAIARAGPMERHSVHGQILSATQLQPVSGASVRVSGPANLLRGVPGAVALPSAGAQPGAGCLTNFCRHALAVLGCPCARPCAGISWEEFGLRYCCCNPQLAADGRLFQREQSWPSSRGRLGGTGPLEPAADQFRRHALAVLGSLYP